MQSNMYDSLFENTPGVTSVTPHLRFPNVVFPNDISVVLSMSDCTTEFIGSFYIGLVFLLTFNSSHALSVSAVAAIVTVLMLGTGRISGAYYNPTVTIAAALVGKLSRMNCLLLIISQVLGGIFSVFVAEGVDPKRRAVYSEREVPASSLLLAEIMFASLLVYTFLLLMQSRILKKDTYLPFAVGLVHLTSGAAIGGGVLGRLLNPAVATGVLISTFLTGCRHCMDYDLFWVAWVGRIYIEAVFLVALHQSCRSG